MFNRKYSLKTRYNFDKVLKRGETFFTRSLIIKVFLPHESVFDGDTVKKKFGIIASNRYSKKAVVQNRIRRVIGEAIRLNIDKFPDGYYYVFVPKKTKEDVNFETTSSEINTFLSKMAIPGPRGTERTGS